MDSFTAHPTALPLAGLSRPAKLPLPLVDPAFALTASAALATRPLSTAISNFDSRPNAPSMLDDPVVIDRTALLTYIAQMAKYEQDIIRLHNEKLLWLHERDILLKQVAQMDIPGSSNAAPVKPTLVSAHDDWVSNVLRSLSSAQAPSPASSTATVSTTTSLSASPSSTALASPAHGELETTPPRTNSLTAKRKRRASSEDDDSSTVNDADYDESFSDDLSEEEFASPAKRAKNGPNAIPSHVSHPAGATTSIGSSHHSQFSSYTHSTPMTGKADSDDVTGDSSNGPQETFENASSAAFEHNASSQVSTSTSSGSHIPYTSAATRRGHLPERAIRYLKLWFFSNKSHPYPTEDEKNVMMDFTGLSRGQINNWFTNARRRLLPRHDH